MLEIFFWEKATAVGIEPTVSRINDSDVCVQLDHAE